MNIKPKPIRLVITRGQGSFTLQNIFPAQMKISDLKELICEKFNELYPEGVEPMLDWTQPK